MGYPFGAVEGKKPLMYGPTAGVYLLVVLISVARKMLLKDVRVIHECSQVNLSQYPGFKGGGIGTLFLSLKKLATVRTTYLFFGHLRDSIGAILSTRKRSRYVHVCAGFRVLLDKSSLESFLSKCSILQPRIGKRQGMAAL